jgi:hypothetical protein
MNCPICNKEFKLTKWQEEFISSAITKKMNFIKLECQKCKWYFYFNPLVNKVIDNKEPTKKDNSVKLSKEEIIDKLKQKKVLFPDSYEQILLSMTGPLHITIKKREWNIYTLEKNYNKIYIDGSSCMAVRQLSVFSETLQLFNKSNYTDDDKGNKFSLNRLSKCITIGEDNGDLLFLDPSDKYSVWCFFHDGGDVLLLEPKFDSFVKKLSKI